MLPAMSQRLLATAVLFFPFLLCTPFAAADEDPVVLAKRYRLDLPVCRPNEKDFTRETQTLPADVLLDRKTQRLFYVGEESKTLAVVPSARGGERPKAGPAKWLYRLVLPVRGWEDTDFAEQTPKVSVEVYRDENTGNRVYVSHTGFLAVLPPGKAPAGKPAQPPRAIHRLKLKVRYGEFEFKYHRYNVEVYRDDNSATLLYVAANGALAVIPAGKAAAGRKSEMPEWSHALVLKVRKPGDDEFRQDSPVWSLEVYQDRNHDAAVYITETLRLAVLPGGKGLVAKAEAPRWLRRFRPAGDAARRWSGEIFLNPNSDHHAYITSRGALAVVPAK
jgi:hypothetical protein